METAHNMCTIQNVLCSVTGGHIIFRKVWSHVLCKR